MDYSLLFSLKHVMLSCNCLVTFVWCFSIGEMQKCFNYDLRRTSTFPQCEKGSNILATIYVCQLVQALHDFAYTCRTYDTWFCVLSFKQRNSIRMLHLFLVDMQWYRHFIAQFYLILHKDKDDSKRTPYTIDALKSVKILSAFNASGDIKVFILTYVSFHLPGGLIPCDIITSFVYC